MAEFHSGRRRISPADEERLRRKFHALADEIMAAMLEGTEDGLLDPYAMDFMGREHLADRLGKKFAAGLLEENVHLDGALARLEAAQSCQCPRCGRDSPRLKDEHGNPVSEPVELKTKVGKVSLTLPRFRCGNCSSVFSPLPTARQSRP